MRQKTRSVSPIRWRYGILPYPPHIFTGRLPPCQWGNFPPRHVSGENLNVIFAWPRTYLRRMVGLAWCPPHSGPSASNVKIWSCSDPCSAVQSNPRRFSFHQTRGDLINMYITISAILYFNLERSYSLLLGAPPPFSWSAGCWNLLISCFSSSRCSLIKTTVSGTGWRSAELNQDQR